MNINQLLWRQPHIGGVVVGLTILFLATFGLFFSSVQSYLATKTILVDVNEKTANLNSKLDSLKAYDLLIQKEAQLFTSFKRHKWKESLTLERLNNAFYNAQKQANIEFLWVQAPSFVEENNVTTINISLLLKVLRDYSFYSFLQRIETEIPGTVTIKKLELQRVKELNAKTAQQVKDGEKVSLFEGKIDLEIRYERLPAAS